MKETATKDLWDLVLNQQWVDAKELSWAVEKQVKENDLDFRTRLLIRDATKALRSYWGKDRWLRWLSQSTSREDIERICRENLGRPGFPFLKDQLMEPTSPETVKALLRELSVHVRRPHRLCVGGSIALILPGYLVRRTQDLDVVDEIPEEIRKQHQVLADLEKHYRLQIAHFQQHYLPAGWDKRVHYLDTFGSIQVYLVDVYDVFLSKLFSIRPKDRDDLRVLVPQLDKPTLIRRLLDTTASMLAAETLRQRAEQNWYILYGETLPS
jgi:hypothetical protein